MQIKLLKPMNPHYKALEQILVNRNIPYEEISHYLSNDIYKKLIDANTELDVWHHYNRKIINELSNNIQDFFARYQAAFTVDKA